MINEYFIMLCSWNVYKFISNKNGKKCLGVKYGL